MKALLAAVLLMLSSSNQSVAFSAWGCGTLCMAQMQNYCPTCGPSGHVNPRMNTPWGYSPWWWGASANWMYPQMYQPGPWYPQSPQWYPGINGGMYPGPAGNTVMAYKPNLYIEGPAGTKISARVVLKNGANWLAAIPKHGDSGWTGTLLEKNQIQTKAGIYRYLYSDYRMSDQGLQDDAGFCVDRKALVPRIAQELKRASFNGYEIADFLDYWSVKMPPGENFCVYPQDERQLNALAPVEVTPTPQSVRRVIFLVQVQVKDAPSSERKFSVAPKHEWSPEPLRAVAAESKGVRVREWGVGFLTALPKKTH